MALTVSSHSVISVDAVFCIDVWRHTLPHVAIRRCMSPFVHKLACTMRQLTAP